MLNTARLSSTVQRKTTVTAFFSNKQLHLLSSQFIVGLHGTIMFLRDAYYHANTGHSPNAVSMLGQRRRRSANIETALGECVVFAGFIYTYIPSPASDTLETRSFIISRPT